MPGVMSVMPDEYNEAAINDTSTSDLLREKQHNRDIYASRFSPSDSKCDYWLVKMEKPGVEVVTKAQMVDYFAQTLMKVLGK